MNNWSMSSLNGSIALENELEGEEVTVTKSIDSLGSIALICNNMTGPAMMGLPSIFIRAGYLPSIACIIYVCVSSSLCGTLLAETIRSIPGNNRFTKNIEFSMAFHHFLGDHWYLVAESLFCLSCLSQALASIVVTSHTLDGFLASFLFRQTYALQILPHLELISWSADSCHSNSNESTSLYNIFLRRQLSSPSLSSEGGGSGECTPFAGDGPLIVSLGFLLVTACFLPLGTGSLKEAMLVQLLSFFGLLLLISQFCVQFYIQGLNYAVPMIGDSQSELAGIVLFNFAYIITVPSWLNEKKDTVSVNKVIWNSALLSTCLYILFSFMAASAFSQINADMLIILTSPKVHFLTRFCAACFGVLIIGCGIPVVCIILKNTLYASRAAGKKSSFFIGALLPYCLAWTLYQGASLLNLLNYTGLIINGLVAFILPLLLSLHASPVPLTNNATENSEEESRVPFRQPSLQQPTLPSSTEVYYHSHEDTGIGGACQNYLPRSIVGKLEEGASGGAESDSTSSLLPSQPDRLSLSREDEEEEAQSALPTILLPYRREIILFIIASYMVIIGSTVVNNTYNLLSNS